MATRQLPAELAGCRTVERRFVGEDIRELAASDRHRLRPRGSRRRMCGDKRSYGRRSAAQVARVLRDRQGEDVYAYECPICSRHHVGHRPVARA
jgi:hypothetical protein